MKEGTKEILNKSDFNFDFLRSFIEAIPGNVLIVDQLGIVVCANNNWKTNAPRFGFNSDSQIIGAAFLPLLSSIDLLENSGLDRLKEMDTLIDENSGEFEYENEINEEKVYISLVGKSFDDHGRNWVLVTFTDTTESKLQEEKYFTEPEEIKAVYGQEEVGIARLSLSGSFLHTNDRFSQIMGYANKELLQSSFCDITYFEDMDISLDYVEDLKNGVRSDFTTTKRYLHKSGELIHGKITITVIHKSTGEPSYFLAILVDISKLMRTEDALNESEINYKNLVNQAKDGISILEKGKMKFINSVMSELTGYTKDELLGQPFEQFIDDGEINKVREIHQMRMQNEKVPTIYQSAIKKKNGGRLDVEFNTQLLDLDGKQLVIIRDISERKKLEEQQKMIFNSLQQERNMFVSGPVVVFKWKNDPNEPLEYTSSNIKDVFGYDSNELTSGSILYRDLIHTDDLLRVSHEILYNSKEFSISSFVHEPYRVMHKDGNPIWVLDHKSIIRDKENKIVNYLGYLVDITEQKNMEEALRKSENKYKMLLDNIPQKIFFKDTNSVYISCNQNYADDLGIEAEYVKGKTDYDLFPEKFAEKFQIDDKRIIANNESEEIVEEYILFGKVIWNRVFKTPVRDENGEVIGVLGIFWDISAQKAMQEALVASEEKFRTLVTNIEEIVYKLDDKGNFLLSEGKGLIQLGLEPGEVVGKSIFELYKDSPDIVKMSKRALAGESVTFETEVQGKYFRNWYTPTINHKGETIGFMGLSVDVTQQKNTEYELTKSRERFHGVVMNLQEGFYSANIDGEVLFYNEQFVNIYELDPKKDHVGLKLSKFWRTPQDREAFINALKAKGSLDGYLIYAKSAKGNDLVLQTNCRLIYDDNGNVLRNEGVFQDVTLQLQAEESLKNSEERLSSFINSATEGFALFDSDFKLIKLNQATLNIFPPEIVKNIKIGNHLLEIAPYLKETDRFEKYQDVLESGKSVSFEDIVLNEKISKQSLNIKAFKSGQGLGMIIQDITAKKEARLELKASEKKYKHLIEQANDGIGLVQDGKVIFTNTELTKMLGYSKDEFIQLGFEDLVEPSELPRILDYHRRRSNNEKIPSIYDTKLLQRNGNTLDVEFNVSTTEYLGKGAILVMARDISERKRVESEILNYQNRLKALASELIVTEEKQRKQIATDLHDHVGQLLASSRLQMAAISQDMDKEEIFDKINDVSQGILQAIQSIRNAIFNLSPPQLNEIGLYGAVSDWLEDQIELKHGIKTRIKGEDRFYPIEENNRFLVFRSIRELLMNVVKHANADNIVVSIIELKNRIEITIEDDGIGFDYKSELLRLKNKSLGLFSINERFSDLGGSMEIDSVIGKGTKITLITPTKRT